MISMFLSQKDSQNTEEVRQLRTLTSKLQELITLHRKYNCRLALSEFEKVRGLPAPEHCLGFLTPDVARRCILYPVFPVPLIQEDATTVVFRMFDRVSAPELIPSVLEKFVRVYIREQNLQEEELLLLYIEVMFSLTFQLLFVSYCVTVYTQTRSMCRGLKQVGRLSSFLPPRGSGSLTQAWMQAPSPAEPSPPSLLLFEKSMQRINA